MEGDGYISDVDSRHAEIALVGSSELLTGFKEFCEKVCGVTEGKQLKVRKSGNSDYRTITYGGKDAVKIVSVLWQHGSIFLERKKLRVEKMIAKHKNKEPSWQ